MTKRIRSITAALALLLAAVTPAWAFDAEQTFKKGTFVLSGEGAYGWQFDLDTGRCLTSADLEIRAQRAD